MRTDGFSNTICTWPAIMSVIDAAVPLYGTCTMSIVARCLNISPIMCGGVPKPGEAKLILPGLALAWAINSATEFTGSFGSVTRRLVLVENNAIGAKFLIGS